MKINTVLEVNSLDEIPEAPEGKKYFACIGGNRNFQCFLEDKTLSRGDFMEIRKYDIADILLPVYYDGEVQVRQDAKYAIPGFFIVSPTASYWSLAELPEVLYLKCMQIAFKIRSVLLSREEIETVYLYYDEHYQKPSSAHFWVLPVFKERCIKDPQIATGEVWNYMDSFEYRYQKERIRNYVEMMKQKLNERGENGGT